MHLQKAVVLVCEQGVLTALTKIMVLHCEYVAAFHATMGLQYEWQHPH